MDRQSDLDNHADQLNPNNDAYWESRDWDERPRRLGRTRSKGVTHLPMTTDDSPDGRKRTSILVPL